MIYIYIYILYIIACRAHVLRQRAVTYKEESTGARSALADAFFVKCVCSMPEDVHSAYNYAHFVYFWRDFADY